MPVAARFREEISLAVRAPGGGMGHRLDRGALLLIDYGFRAASSITSSAAVAR